MSAMHRSRKLNKYERTFITEEEVAMFRSRSKQIQSHDVFKRFLRNIKQNKRREKRSIAKFIEMNKVPSWYRELSTTQMNAADSLHGSIRDDLEQGTVYRCRQALLALGIKPLVTHSIVRFSLKICGASDLAFLWFLGELYCSKTCAKCRHYLPKYSVNEQIIMSSICHLDMVTTLRQLDKLLPMNRKEVIVEDKKPKLKKSENPISPYLQPLIRPPSTNENVFTQIAFPAANFTPYEKYLDTSYVVPNETTRWFKHGIQAENASEPLGSHAKNSGIHIVSQILENQINKVAERTSTKYGNLKAQCETHRIDMKRNEEMAKTLTYMTNCGHYENLGKQQMAARHKIRALMKADQQQRNKQNKCLQNKFQLQTWLRMLIQDLACNIPDDVNLKKKFQKDETTHLEKLLHRSCVIYGGKSLSDQNGARKSTNKYFTGPRRHSPYTFDYKKIFQSNFPKQSDSLRGRISAILNKFASETDIIQKYFDQKPVFGMQEFDEIHVNALNSQNLLKDHLGYRKITSTKTSKFYASDQENDIYRRVDKHSPIVDNLNSYSSKTPFATATYYNPNCNAQMEKLLTDAFDIMKQDGRFVLVTLPDAHKLPILLEWVKARYGKVNSPKQREYELKQSLKQFEHLIAHNLVVKIPEAENICPSKVVSYKSRDKILDKTRTMINKYFHEVSLELLDHAKISWDVMKPYHCSSGPPRNIFFSYMPASEYDVLPFRPWKLCEYVDVASEYQKCKHKQKIM